MFLRQPRTVPPHSRSLPRRGDIHVARWAGANARGRLAGLPDSRDGRRIFRSQRSSGRHKCRPYAVRVHSTATSPNLRSPPRRGDIHVARWAGAFTRGCGWRDCAGRAADFRSWRSSGRHKCRPYAVRVHPTATIRPCICHPPRRGDIHAGGAVGGDCAGRAADFRSWRSSGRHKCRPYAVRVHPTATSSHLRSPPRRGDIHVARWAGAFTRGDSRWAGFAERAADFPLATVIRATQVSPLRRPDASHRHVPTFAVTTA